MAYIGTSPSNGVRRRFVYEATSGQTSFSGNDESGITLTYVDSLYLDVFQNGIKLKAGDDYTATTGTTVVLVQGASADDVLEMVAFDVFSVNDSVSASAGGSFGGNVGMGGTLAVTGETTLSTHLNMGDGDIIKLGASADLQIQHTGSDSRIIDSGTGSLFLGGSTAVGILNTALNEYMINAVADGAVTLYHNNVAKLATASTGVTVTGIATTQGILQFAAGGAIANSSGGEVSYYANGALQGTDASLLNGPVPAAITVERMNLYVNGNLSGGGARVYVAKNGSIITGTNKEIDVTQGAPAFAASAVNTDFAVGDRIGIKIILENGASAAWYHVNLLFRFKL